jgi:alpha-L-fucosidase 2
VQSTETEITLLPALPDAWPDGSVKGLCARGGFEIAMAWNHKLLTRATITAKADGKTTLKRGDKQKELTLKKGEPVEITW